MLPSDVEGYRQRIGCSHVSVGWVDFRKGSYEAWDSSSSPCYDLASLTKPLSLSLLKLTRPELFDEPMELLLNHRGGLAAFGRLHLKTWKDHLRSFKIQESPTLYSDYSSLRLLIELSDRGVDLGAVVKEFYGGELVHWRDLGEGLYPSTGYRGGRPISGQVNDPNAFVLGFFCSHAGLFATLCGLCESLLKLQKECGLIEKVTEAMGRSKERFVEGLDRAHNDGLAGEGHSPLTFGHLGFTGTSFWIDGHKKLGALVLTNATQDYGFDRKALNDLRRKYGESVWARA